MVHRRAAVASVGRSETTGRFRDAVNVGSAALRLAVESGEGWFPRIVSAISPAVRSADPDERFIGLLHGVLAAAAHSDDHDTARRRSVGRLAPRRPPGPADGLVRLNLKAQFRPRQSRPMRLAARSNR